MEVIKRKEEDKIDEAINQAATVRLKKYWAKN
jgi:hypothetical protein